jgi:hypothetical protein
MANAPPPVVKRFAPTVAGGAGDAARAGGGRGPGDRFPADRDDIGAHRLAPPRSPGGRGATTRPPAARMASVHCADTSFMSRPGR